MATNLQFWRPPIDRKLTTELTTTVFWKRKRYRLTPFRDGWRIRSRARGDEFDWFFPACSAAKARSLALERFEGEAVTLRPPSSTATLEDVASAYLEMPKKAGEASAYNNVTRLRSVVRLALGKELGRVFVTEAGPKLWNAYMAAKQGGKLDLAKRRLENAAINAAVRGAASMFIPRLRPGYRERGIAIPDDATVIQWLPTMKLPKPQAADVAMIEAWREMPRDALFWAVGLARFAGLRQQEASGCQRDWIIEDRGGIFVEMRDRPEQGWLSKTGEIYRARIINPAFAAELLVMPPGLIVHTPPGMSRLHWFRFYPQEWLKPFTGAARMPLHRLRGLYADDVKRITEDAVAAHLAGVKAASEALGHTSTATTERSYLSDALR